MDIANYEKKYTEEGHFTYSCQYLFIFHTENRRSIIEGDIKESLMDMLYSKQNDFGYSIIKVKLMPDNVQMTISTNLQRSVFEIMNEIRNYTANKLRETYPSLKTRLPSIWTRECFISTVGTVCMKSIKDYLNEQKRK